MARNTKHRVGEVAEQYSDYGLLISGAIAFAALVGAIAMITIFPDANGGSGLFSLADTFFSVDGTAVTFAAAIASGSGLVAYGTNQMADELMNVKESWKETEFVAGIVAAGLPLAHEFLTEISSITAGEPMMQGLFLAGYTYSMFYLVDL